MWRAATIRSSKESHALRMLTQLKLSTRPSPSQLLPSTSSFMSPSFQKRHQSSMETADTLEEVMTSIEEQAMEDERRRAIENPTPWFSLLHYPSRAAWRSTDHILGVKDQQVDDGNSMLKKKTSALSQTQFNLLQHSQRTNKQLKRTYRRIMETHKELALKRERERRLAANLTDPKQNEGSPDGNIKDGKGRNVGSWRDKNKMSNSASLCDDPSAAMALSMGLSNSKPGGGKGDSRPNDGMSVKSAKSASKLARSKDMSSTNAKEKPVLYGPEQTLTNVRYRLGPNYSIVKRVLSEVQSLMGGNPPEGSKRQSYRPKRVLDFGSGVGSSSAAALDVFGVSRSGDSKNSSSTNSGAATADTNGIEWIHSIDASKSMRDATENVLKSMLEGAPWDQEEIKLEEDKFLDEELQEYERIISEFNGEAGKKREERQKKRMKKWEQTWTKQTNSRTRLTFGESIVDASSFYSNPVERNDRPSLPWQQQLDEQRQKTMQKKNTEPASNKGSFDLILCSYTMSELPNIPSSLAAAALLWEKLAPNGVIVFVEPGTPDGFGALRSVRSMLLECCPPPEIKEKKRVMKENAQEEEEEEEDSDDEDSDEVISSEDDGWHEECHVIAPCTHNGTCPMSRHQRNHVKSNTRFGKYEAAEPIGEEESEDESEGGGQGSELEGLLGEWDTMSDDEKDDIKMLLGGEEDMTDEQVEAMVKALASMDEDDDAEEEEEEEEDSDTDDDDQEYYNIDGETKEPSSKSSPIAQTHVFDTSFCSFVHSLPGGTSRRKGEKFTYLVLQKRVPDSKDNESDMVPEDHDSLDEVDVVEMLSKSVHHAQKLKKEELRKRLQEKRLNHNNGGTDDSEEIEVFDTYHTNQSQEILQKAVEVEGEYLDSSMDSLGLEMLGGDGRRKGWGRLIRAPLKRGGHVLLDYCSAGCGGCSQNKSDSDDDWFDGKGSELPDGTQGRITRQKVSRGWSARAAPGSYSAARKARWGGLWPDLSERVKHAEREDEKERYIQKKDSGC
mmetsp:Transcript_7327/g.16609  ORF Transcript_7327/g.16609 Transcript_7327/m.16609 type:complete len:1010 (-) Transcript_7327:60-3089(-)